MKGAWSFWIVGHLVNFAFIPHHRRILYVNVMGVAWGTFLSRMQSEPTVTTSAGGDRNLITHRDAVVTPLDWLVEAAGHSPLDDPLPALVMTTGAWGAVATVSYASLGLYSVMWASVGWALTGMVAYSTLQVQAKSPLKPEPAGGNCT
jgi:hypothetical protein